MLLLLPFVYARTRALSLSLARARSVVMLRALLPAARTLPFPRASASLAQSFRLRPDQSRCLVSLLPRNSNQAIRPAPARSRSRSRSRFLSSVRVPLFLITRRSW